jgi:DNA-binding NarL/FixJ family response regulator
VNSNQPKNILIIDDHPLVNSGLSNIIRKRWADTEILVSETLLDAEFVLSRKSFDMAIMDIQLSDGLIFDLMAKSDYMSKIRLPIFLSGHLKIPHIEKAIFFGAKGILSKGESTIGLMNCIERVFAGETVYSNSVEDKIAPSARSLGMTTWGPLTKREYGVMKLLAEGKSTREVSQTLDISPKTVDRHRCNLMKKLNIHSQLKLTHFAIREGILVV